MDLFDDVVVEGGPAHYAEPFAYGHPLVMPANALVNALYVVVGVIWLASNKRKFPPAQRPVAAFFATLAVCYAPVQFMRITTQTRFWGIADQWFTLPFFATVVPFSWASRGLLAPLRVALLYALSISSFLLACFHPLGFDVALGCHIVAAVGAALSALRFASEEGRRAALFPFCLAIASCTGFVFLKVFDHDVPTTTLHSPVELLGVSSLTLTGHFFSKICDAMQVHFVCSFFAALAADEAKRRKTA